MKHRWAVAVIFSILLGALVSLVCIRLSEPVFETLGDGWRTRQDLAEGRRFPQELAAAKAQGLPTQMADLQKPLPPPMQNAAPVYTRLMVLLKAHPLSAAEEATMTLHAGVSPSATQWMQIARLMHDRADVVALVHQAASRPDCVFVRNWTQPDPADILFPELATVRQSARLLELESLLMAHRGKSEAAAQNQALGFRIAEHGASDGTLNSYLVGLAVDAITLEGMKRIMTMIGPNVALDNTVGVLIAKDFKPHRLSVALRSEVAFQQGIIAYLHKTGPQGLQTINADLQKPGMSQGNWDAVLDYNSVFLLKQMERVIQVADKPYMIAHPVLSEFEAQSTDIRHSARFLAAIVAPALGTVSGKGAQSQAIAEVYRAGADVLSQTAREGHPPDHLPVAVVDPYMGKPLGYRREGTQGFVIYSAGADGHFDGGKPGEYSWKPYQVAFRYPGQQPVAATPHTSEE